MLYGMLRAWSQLIELYPIKSKMYLAILTPSYFSATLMGPTATLCLLGCRSSSSRRQSAATSTSLCHLHQRMMETTTSPGPQSGTTSAKVEKRPDTLPDWRAPPSTLRVLLSLPLSKLLITDDCGHEFYPVGLEPLGSFSTPSSQRPPPTSSTARIIKASPGSSVVFSSVERNAAWVALNCTCVNIFPLSVFLLWSNAQLRLCRCLNEWNLCFCLRLQHLAKPEFMDAKITALSLISVFTSSDY